MKTLKAALASVTCNTICTVCGKPADAGYLNVPGKEGCVAMIHDGYSIGLRRELIRKWGKSPRLSGVPGAGLIDLKRMQC